MTSKSLEHAIHGIQPSFGSILGQIMVKMVSEGRFLFDFGISWKLFWNFRESRFQHVPEVLKNGPGTIEFTIFEAI